MNIYLNAIKTLAASIQGYGTGNLPTSAATNNQLTTILNIVIGIIAAVSVLFIVIGGLRYVLSDGDPQKATKAKETVIYALVGILIAVSAEAIVAFALNHVNNNT